MKRIPGYEDYYSITADGHVYSHITNKQLACHAGNRLYYSVKLCKNGVRKVWAVHALAALTYLGPRPKGMQINHIDGNKQNNNPTNLEYVTPSGNARHAIDTGLRKGLNNGEACNWAKLSQQQVDDIRVELGSTTIAEVARKYGVSYHAIHDIATGANWGGVVVQPKWERNRKYDRHGIIAALRAGEDRHHIADRFHVCLATVRNIYNAENVKQEL